MSVADAKPGTETASVIGIDLGTTMSAVAVLDPYGKPMILNNSEGDPITPSVVYFESPNNKVVGRSARNAAASDPELVVEAAKNDMGKDTTWEMHGESYTPEQVSAIILRRLKEDAEQALGGVPVGGAVITVPAIFGDAERQATRNAAEIAGLHVVSILEEPVAAAIAYGFGGDSGAAGHNGTMLIYDLGGGTFDITVMRVSEGRFEMLITHGNRRLGGKDWDKALADELAERFLAEHGDAVGDPRDDVESRADLMQKAETAKKDLSQRESVRVAVGHAGKRTRTELTRADFDRVTGDLLEQTRTTLAVALNDLRENGRLPGGWAEIDKVLLVGGSSRMPQVAAMLAAESGHTPEMLDVDLVVAQGAALYAAMRTIQQARADGGAVTRSVLGLPPDIEAAMNDVEVERVCSFAIGIAAIDNGVKQNSVVVPVNSPLPMVGTRTFGTSVEGQRTARISVFEGDAPDLELCIPLGVGVLSLPPGLPVQTEIEVTIGLSDESFIMVSATETQTEGTVEFTLERTVDMTPEQISEARLRLSRDTVE
jgi:molecular chaperone DnaK (HSP70)